MDGSTPCKSGAAGALGLCGTAAVLAPHSLLLAGVPAMGTVGEAGEKWMALMGGRGETS